MRIGIRDGGRGSLVRGGRTGESSDAEQRRATVMDEAHVALTHRHFRPGMDRLVGVMRTIRVPVVPPTATLPPSMEMDLRVALACRVWDVIRAQTMRRDRSGRGRG